MGAHRQQGFTLVELIMVITIVGILAAMGVTFFLQPFEGALDLSRRAELVDAADNALRRMQRDLRQALPNSVRIGASGRQIELLHTVDGGRYRADGAGDRLDFTAPDNGFDVMGSLRAAPADGQSIVVYNLSATGPASNAYAGDNRTVVSGSTASYIALSTPFQFPLSSPSQRFFIIDQPVSYVCDLTAGTLRRVSGYSNLQSNAPPGSFSGGDSAIVAQQVSACSFSYQAGTANRTAVATLDLTLSAESEVVRLLQQVHVENAP